MITKNELMKWTDVYDDLKYPTDIYQNLVVNGKDHPRKFSLMGAWKTGSLRTAYNGTEYTDSKGYKYAYTKRWDNSAPVGFAIWNHISDNQSQIKDKIPTTFPTYKRTVPVYLKRPYCHSA